MKIATQTDEVVHYGQRRNTAKSFTFKASAKQVEILVSRIYKDKVSAIIRELCCNAYDAHVVVGKVGTPFRVTLPGTLDQRFVVRDFGPGLTEEEVEEVYTQFFNSTKDESNDLIGALGLGGKAPFCLVDAYTVTSYQNGTMMCYTLFKQDGLLQYRAETMEPVPTDEPDGLEVSVPIPTTMANEFNQRAGDILYWFDVRPDTPTLVEAWQRIDSGLIESFPTSEGQVRIFNTSSATSGYSRTTWGNSYGSVYVRMGQVLYPVSHPELSRLDMGRVNRLVIDVPIGAVDIQAGREELSYDAVTLEYLRDRLARAEDQVHNHVAAAVAAAPNIRAANAVRVEMSKLDISRKGQKYKGLPLDGGTAFWPCSRFFVRDEFIASLFNKEDIECAANEYGHQYSTNHLHRVLQHKLDGTFAYVLVDDDIAMAKKLTNLRKMLRRDFAESEELVRLVIIDGRQGGYYHQPSRHHGYDDPEERKASQPKVLKPAEVASIIAALDPTDRIYQLSKIKSSQDSKDFFSFNLEREQGFINRREWRPAKPGNKPGVYWPLENGTLKHCAGRNNTSQYGISDLDRHLGEVFAYIQEQFPDASFLLVPEDRISELAEGWVNIPEFMAAKLKEKLKDGRWRRGFVRSMATGLRQHVSNLASNAKAVAKLLVPGHPIRKLCELNAYDTVHADDYALFHGVLWLADDKRTNPVELRKRSSHSAMRDAATRRSFANRVADDYPLVFSYGYASSKQHIDDLALYANTKFEVLKANQGDDECKTKARVEMDPNSEDLEIYPEEDFLDSPRKRRKKKLKQRLNQY